MEYSLLQNIKNYSKLIFKIKISENNTYIYSAQNIADNVAGHLCPFTNTQRRASQYFAGLVFVCLCDKMLYILLT